MRIFIEIRAAEGGDDSKLFVSDLSKAYQRMAQKSGWIARYEYVSPGITVLQIDGNNLENWYNEAGGHRIQRIPPTERKGRTHTSTVTVAVLNYNPSLKKDIDEKEFEIEWFSGTGKGGQNRNKKQCCCRLKHIPTGMVSTAQTRSRINSYNEALSALKKRIEQEDRSTQYNTVNSIRKEQVGSGMRGDKIRTIQFQHNTAVDHRTGKRCTSDQYIRGEMYRLWP